MTPHRTLTRAARTLAAVLLFAPLAAVAQEDPEAVYAKVHKAALAGNADEMISYASARQKADLGSKSKAEKDAVIGVMAKMFPKTYTVTGKNLAGETAVLQGTGTGGIGNSAMYLTANFVKEGGAWKIDQWGWSSDKPGPLAQAKPAAPSPAAKAEPKAEVRTEAKAAAKAAPPPAAVRRTRANDRDARECLAWITTPEIARCAEKFR
jgi:hypothetical protein